MGEGRSGFRGTGKIHRILEAEKSDAQTPPGNHCSLSQVQIAEFDNGQGAIPESLLEFLRSQRLVIGSSGSLFLCNEKCLVPVEVALVGYQAVGS